MQFPIQQFVSPFIQNQFPRFYLNEGPNLIAFMQTYYQFLEQQSQPVGAGRQLYDYRDIDNTLDQFLVHFQKKYLYGIPFNVVINLRFLLKHVLDVYRSKGSIQCYGLLFRLIYDLDSRVYIPGIDILKASDGTWFEPKYLEVAYAGNLDQWLGYGIVGQTSGTTAVVENYTIETVDNNLINVLYLSNVLPVTSQFISGETIAIDPDGVSISNAVTGSTTLIGSLSGLTITSATSGFSVGDTLAVAHVDPITGLTVSHGLGGFLRVASVGYSSGQIRMSVQGPGFGYTQNATCMLYRGTGDTTDVGALYYMK